MIALGLLVALAFPAPRHRFVPIREIDGKPIPATRELTLEVRTNEFDLSKVSLRANGHELSFDAKELLRALQYVERR